MLQIVTNYICFCMMVTMFFIGINEILDNKKNITKIEILMFYILVLILTLIYSVNYNIIIAIVSVLLVIATYTIIFKKPIINVLISVITIYFIMFIIDILMSIILSLFLNVIDIRTNKIQFIITNLIISILTLLVINIPIINKNIKFIVNRITLKKKVNTILLYVIVFFIIILLFYSYFLVYKTGNSTFANNIILILLVLIIISYIKNKVEYVNLESEYDELFNYVQDFEEWIEKEQANRHEYKNQLSELRIMTTNKKLINKIDLIIKDNINIDDKMIEQLHNFPKNGLKGLLYYKINLANKNNLNLCVDVSPNITEHMKKMSNYHLKVLCRLIGIYFDNAIEGCINTNTKNISLEIYMINMEINFVITNSIKKPVDIEKLREKDITTKGKGRGRGLYYASKILQKNNWLHNTAYQKNNYYINKLTIKQEECSI